MKKLFVIFCLTVCFTILAQNNIAKIDSLESKLSTTKNKDKVDVLSELILEHLQTDPQKSIDYGYQSIRLAEKLELNKNKARLLVYVGVAYEYKGNYTKALEMYNESLDLAVSLDDKVLEASALINIAVVNQNLKHYGVSLNKNLQALEIYRDLEDQNGIASVKNNIGNVYLYLEQYKKALDYYLQSIEIKLSLKKTGHLASTYQNIALVYQALQDYDNAIKNYDFALQHLKKTDNRYDIAVTYENLSKLYFLKKEYNKALFFVNESLHLQHNLQNTIGICSAKIQLARILIEQKKFKQALKHLKASNQLAIEKELRNLLSENFEAYSTYYQKTGKFQQALEYYKNYKTLSDSLQSDINEQQLQELNIRFETAQRLKEIEILKQEAGYNKQTRNFLIYVVVFGILVVVFLLNLYYEKIKDSKIKQEFQERLQQSELKYRSLTENIKVAVFTFNAEGKFTYVNKATTDITGYSEQELLKMQFYDIIYPTYRDKVFKMGMSRIKGEKLPSGHEFPILTKSGKSKWTDTSSIRINIGGEFLVLGSSIDVTDRNMTHRKLAESEAQLRALFAARGYSS